MFKGVSDSDLPTLLRWLESRPHKLSFERTVCVSIEIFTRSYDFERPERGQLLQPAVALEIAKFEVQEQTRHKAA